MEAPNPKKTSKKILSKLNMTLIGLAIAQLGVIVFFAKNSRFFHRTTHASAPLISALEIDLDQIVPKFVAEPTVDFGPAILPFEEPSSMLVVYRPPQPAAPGFDIRLSIEKEVVLDLSAPPAEYTKPVKKVKTKVAKAPIKVKEKKSQKVAKHLPKKSDKRAKVAQKPKLERVKVVSLPAKRSSQKVSRSIASIAPAPQESSLDRAASLAADESYHENSQRRDTRRKEMAHETERQKGVFEEE